MTDVKKPRVFIRNDEEPGPWYYLGTMSDSWSSNHDLRQAIGDRIYAEMEDSMGGTDSDSFRVEVRIRDLTDAEVAELPED